MWPWKVNINNQSINALSLLFYLAQFHFQSCSRSSWWLFLCLCLVLHLLITGFFLVYFFKVEPRRAKTILLQRDCPPLGHTQRLLWLQRDARLLSLDRWVNLQGMARKGQLGEFFLLRKVRRKGIPWNVFQRQSKLSCGCDVRLHHKLLWGTLCLGQQWNILFSNSYAQVSLAEPCAFAKCCEVYQWSCDAFVDEK